MPVERLVIDARAAGRRFPHFWDHMFGSGRAVLVLRANYQHDLAMMKAATGIRFVRFHGLLDRGVGLTGRHTAAFYNRHAAGAHGDAADPAYNFSYVDQIMDALLAHGVRPYVELDFMPPALARDPKMVQSFWYHPVVSPPRSYAQWDDMIKALARNFIEQYGINEVAKWYFEVWNEPNLSFWGGVPKQSTYFTLYDHTARALQDVSKRLRVGGPATAQAAWVSAFLRHAAQAHVPVDFVSTHVYGNDTAKNVFGKNEKISRRTMVCRAVRKVHEEIARSPYPHLPLILSEYNASYSNEPDVTDTPYMGPWIASTIRQCDGLVHMMSYWTFSDVFEEQGVVRKPFYGGFGLIAEDNIPKPAFNAFALLHRLGHVRLLPAARSALITRRRDGSLVLALWDYSPPDGRGPKYTPPPAHRSSRVFRISVHAFPPRARGYLWRVDDHHGDVIRAFNAMGRPRWPTRQQIAVLQAAGRLAPARPVQLNDGRITIVVPQHGLALLLLNRR
jgi:xylan 1,4-beta-xylosidase